MEIEPVDETISQKIEERRLLWWCTYITRLNAGDQVEEAINRADYAAVEYDKRFLPNPVLVNAEHLSA